MVEMTKLKLALILHFLEKTVKDMGNDITHLYINEEPLSISLFISERLQNETQNEQDISDNVNYFLTPNNILLSSKADIIRIHLGKITENYMGMYSSEFQQEDSGVYLELLFQDAEHYLNSLTDEKFSTVVTKFRSMKNIDVNKESIIMNNNQIIKAIVDTVVEENKTTIASIKAVTDVTDLAIKSSDLINKITQDVRAVGNAVADAAALQAAKKVLLLSLTDDNTVDHAE